MTPKEQIINLFRKNVKGKTPNVEGKKSESSLYSSIIAVITPVSEAFIFDGSANINEELIVFPLNCPKYE